MRMDWQLAQYLHVRWVSMLNLYRINGTTPCLQENDAVRLWCLLSCFPVAFSTDDTDLGSTNLVKHRIITGEAEPIRQRPRRVPLAKRSHVNDLVPEMLGRGVIKLAYEPWFSPITLVKRNKKVME